MRRRDLIGAAGVLAQAGWGTHAKADAAVTIADAAWLAGRWTGEGLGGTAEESWSPPAAGAMVGHFQLARAGAIVFYELMQIAEDGGGLTFKVKHFNRDFTGWEEKADAVVFPFVSVAPTLLRFRSLVFERTGENAMTATVTLRQRDGRVEEAPFRFVRAAL